MTIHANESSSSGNENQSMDAVPSNLLVVDFFKAYWRHFHADESEMPTYKKFIADLQAAPDPVYFQLEEWNQKEQMPAISSKKVIDSVGCFCGEYKRNGISGLQGLIEEWNNAGPGTHKKERPHRPFRIGQVRNAAFDSDYVEREQDKDYEPREFL